MAARHLFWTVLPFPCKHIESRCGLWLIYVHNACFKSPWNRPSILIFYKRSRLKFKFLNANNFGDCPFLDGKNVITLALMADPYAVVNHETISWWHKFTNELQSNHCDREGRTKSRSADERSQGAEDCSTVSLFPFRGTADLRYVWHRYSSDAVSRCRESVDSAQEKTGNANQTCLTAMNGEKAENETTR